MGRFDFSKIAVSRTLTRRWKLAELGVTLVVASATEANKPYWNELMRVADGRQAKQRLAGMIEDRRASDVELFAAYVIKGWEGVVDKDGGAVPFSAAAAREWLLALLEGAADGDTAWVFDALCSFCRDEGNFVPSAATRGATGGNSSGG